MQASATYYRPIVCTGLLCPDAAMPLAGGPFWFDRAERLERGHPAEVVPIRDIPAEILTRLSEPRAPICGLAFDRPRLMGILNVTPDSFSDGGKFDTPENAVAQASQMIEAGADILDIGGESTRPGADFVPENEEIQRIRPVVTALREAGHKTAISIDTRKANVAQAALIAGANLVNDVSALGFDPEMARLVSDNPAPVCLMHSLSDPKTMQDNPSYKNVLLDVFDFLAARIKQAESVGIPRSQILVDPGIGFGKTTAHNLALLRGISLFHGLGCAILLGVSRKRMIGEIAGEPQADRRVSGSIALGLAALDQGVQILRVHDIKETRQALDLWLALHFMD